MDITATTISLPAWRWLQETQQATVHSVFAQACNLRNERGDWLSLALPALGIGPFAVVVSLPAGGFHHWLTPQMPALLSPSTLTLPSLTIRLSQATLWQPRPNWPGAPDAAWANALTQVSAWLPPFTLAQSPYAAAAQEAQAALQMGLQTVDLAACYQGAAHLSGLGPGLTPAGDDFLLGVMAALWLVWPEARARAFSQAMTAAVAPRTTALSAAWLVAAAAGQVSSQWHRLLEALSNPQAGWLRRAVDDILAIGASSGADALVGFVWAAQILVQWQHE